MSVMDCPKCGHDKTRVVDSRPVDGRLGKRWRRCCSCDHKFITYEILVSPESLFRALDEAATTVSAMRQKIEELQEKVLAVRRELSYDYEG